MLQPTDWSNLLTTGDLQRLTCDPHVSGWHAWLNDTLVDFATRGVVASVQGNYVAVNCAFWKYLTGFHNDKKEDDARLRKLAAQYGVWDSDILFIPWNRNRCCACGTPAFCLL